MSLPSFPRAEHIALLRNRIVEGLSKRGLRLEVSERGLNQMKCQYRFGLRRPDRRPPSSPSESVKESKDDSANDWAEPSWEELAIHFQVAHRVEEGQDEAEFDRILESFLSRRFPEFSVPHDGG